MNDLISRAAVLDYPIRLNHYDEEHGNRHFILGIESVMEYVESLPSAESEIIYCKDCKFTDGIKPIADGRYWCLLHSCYMYFCSDAERKTDGSD